MSIPSRGSRGFVLFPNACRSVGALSLPTVVLLAAGGPPSGASGPPPGSSTPASRGPALGDPDPAAAPPPGTGPGGVPRVGGHHEAGLWFQPGRIPSPDRVKL